MSWRRWSRGTLLLLLAAAQAFASTGQLLHLCRMRDEPRACHCPHKVEAADTKRAPAAAIESAACCDRHVIEAAQAPVTFERQNLAAALAPSLSPTSFDLRPWAPEVARRPHLRPPAHGPPLYLHIRTLLI